MPLQVFIQRFDENEGQWKELTSNWCSLIFLEDEPEESKLVVIQRSVVDDSSTGAILSVKITPNLILNPCKNEFVEMFVDQHIYGVHFTSLEYKNSFLNQIEKIGARISFPDENTQPNLSEMSQSSSNNLRKSNSSFSQADTDYDWRSQSPYAIDSAKSLERNHINSLEIKSNQMTSITNQSTASTSDAPRQMKLRSTSTSNLNNIDISPLPLHQPGQRKSRTLSELDELPWNSSLFRSLTSSAQNQLNSIDDDDDDKNHHPPLLHSIHAPHFSFSTTSLSAILVSPRGENKSTKSDSRITRKGLGLKKPIRRLKDSIHSHAKALSNHSQPSEEPAEPISADMQVSAPINVDHLLHVTYDEDRGRYEGLPDEWSYLNRHFGKSYDDVPKRAVEGYESKIPCILELLKKLFIDCGGHKTEGIFRLAPDKMDLDIVKAQIDSGKFDSCEDVNILATLIKVFFRDLPEGLFNNIPDDVIVRINVATFPEVPRELANILEPKKSLILWVLDLMAQVVMHEQLTKMTSRNMAIVMAPNLMRVSDHNPNELITYTQKIVEFTNKILVWRLISKWHFQAI